MSRRDAKSSNPGAEGDPAFREHYDGSQFRIETWNRLKDLTETVARGRGELGEAFEPAQDELAATLAALRRIERYWAFPGKRLCRELERMFERRQRRALARETARIVRLLVGDGYRQMDLTRMRQEDAGADDAARDGEEDNLLEGALVRDARPYFEVLVVDEIDAEEQRDLRKRMLEMRSTDDEFIYDIVVVPSFEDAIIGVLLNYNVQSCVLRYRFPLRSRTTTPALRRYLEMLEEGTLERAADDPSGVLAGAIQELRPELDLFKVTDETVGSVAASRTRCFRRVFYRQEDHLELHLSILKGIRERFDTPFFSALKSYSHRPTGVFHALPISRGKSITKSHWIGDMGRFYGRNIFLAETSSTTGGLDSLLQPTGPLKRAQESFARAFGSRHSFFVTNGTSTANKIVTQALVRPGDLVLLSHDCHKSHPYALVLSGAQPVYLDAYPLSEFAMFGGVPLREIKRQLFALRQAGKLDRVRMLLLTNCTFDGIAYDPFRIMREILAIKPDMVFLWDEAWFAFACATPTYRQRTGMAAAKKLHEMFASAEYRRRYEEFKADFDKSDPDDERTWLDCELLPDPDEACVRVYATQSTHKTLTSLRQGSAIHVYDQRFEREARLAFHEAYMTHTSTSPNYQILASLDIGRRQVELEGYEFVRNMVGLAMMIRRQIVEHPLLNKYFRVLKAKDLIPAEYRPSGLERFYDRETGFNGMMAHWRDDEFALDPTRITIHVGATGWDGDTFRKMLMERFDIQINKTSRNTILFMLNIGSSRGSATYLLDVLVRVAEELETRAAERDDVERTRAQKRVASLVDEYPPLPHFSRFHPAFVDDPRGDTREGDMRGAFFLAYEAKNCDYVQIEEALPVDRPLVSAAFVTPYPPGFPILVPGQVVTEDILDYLLAVDVKEIHGFDPARGLLVFRDDALDRQLAARSSHKEMASR